MNLIQFVKNLFTYYNYRPVKRLEPRVVFPTKPRADLHIDTTKKLPWRGIVIHHTAGDDTSGEDFYSVEKFHTSFRINYDIWAAPVVRRQPGVAYVEYYGRLYEKDKVDEFERRKAREKGSFLYPWRYIGYHYVVETVGGQARIWNGRPIDVSGAHSAVVLSDGKINSSYNYSHIGVAAIGNFDKTAPSEIIWNALLMVCRTLCDVFKIPQDRIIGHREVFDLLAVPRLKSCPGNLFDMNAFRSQI